MKLHTVMVRIAYQAKVSILNNISLVLVMTLLFAIVFEINTLKPYGAEDFGLSGPREMMNASLEYKVIWILSRITGQFLKWNSRIGEQLAIVFLTFDKVYFNIVNSAMFLGLVYIIRRMCIMPDARVTEEDQKFAPVIMAFVFSMIILFFPALGEVFFWLTGSTNYLWSAVILLAFFMYYWNLIVEGPAGKGFLFNFYISTLGFFAGLTNENTVPVILVSIGIILLYLHNQGRPIHRHKWPIIGAVSFLAGYLVLLFSPATKTRVLYFNTISQIPDASLSLYWGRLVKVCNTWAEVCGGLTIAIGLLSGIVAFLWWRRYIDLNRIKSIKWVGMLYICSHLSVVLLIFCPYVEKRAFTLIFLISVLMILSLGREIAQYPPFKKFVYLSVVLVVTLGIVNLNIIFEAYHTFHQEAEARENAVLALANTGQKEIFVREFKTVDSRILHTGDRWVSLVGEWTYGNQEYSKYYGVKSIKILPYAGKRFFPLSYMVKDNISFFYEDIQYNHDSYYFRGWGFVPRDNAADYLIYVVLEQDNGIFHVFDTKKQERPDVVKLFSDGHLLQSGFESVIITKEMPPGTYQVWIGLRKTGEKTKMLIKKFFTKIIVN